MRLIRMKKIVLTKFNTILSMLLSLIGFSAIGCEEAVMYGTLSTGFQIIGYVTDGNNSPIQNIKVKFDTDSTYTDPEGNYILFSDNIDDVTLPITFEDIDGEENGKFMTHLDSINLNEVEVNEIKTMNIILTEIITDEEDSTH